MSDREFFKLLFESNEYACFSNDPYGTSLVTGFHTFFPGTQFFAINPLHTSRKDANVTAYRNLLFELDQMAGIEEQLKFIEEKGLPFTSAVYSGGKSVHFIVSLAQPLDSEDNYRRLWKRIRAALDDKPDRSTSNPSRFSRTPGALRVDSGRQQQLLKLNGRVELAPLEQWLVSHGVFAPIDEPLVKCERKHLPVGMKGILTPWTERFIALGAAHGEWNLQLFKSSCDAFRNNYEEQEWCELLERTLVIELDKQDLKTIQSAWNTVSKE